MKQACCRRPFVSRGIGALIEILIVALIIIGGIMMYASMNRGAESVSTTIDNVGGGAPEPQSLAGKAVRKAVSTECQSNLRQLRIMIDADKDPTVENGGYPPTLQSIQGAAPISMCPVSGEPYQYDPATGQVHCTQSGHEQY